MKFSANAHRVRAMAFDAAGTLFHAPETEALMARLARETGCWAGTANDMALGIMAAGKRALWPEDSSDRPQRVARWRSFFAAAFEEAGVPPREAFELAEPCASYTCRPESYVVYPDVFPTLRALEGFGVPLALISNFDGMLWEILDHLHLRPHFGVAIASHQAGVYKPHPQIFQAALQALGLPAQQVGYVGDSPYSDMFGASRVGMVGILVDRDSRNSEFEGERIASLCDLIGWIQAGGAA